MKIISETIIGSHVWKMDTSKSDLDLFQIYLEPTEKILNGTASKKSYFKQENNTDLAIHEAEKVIGQLLKGNVNFIIGVLSNLVKLETPEFLVLRDITQKNLAKNCHNSIYGMCSGNYKRYVESGLDTSKRKCNQILRVIDFGINILMFKELQFKPASYEADPEIIKLKLKDLDCAFKDSKLPEKPNETPFRYWLLNVRRDDLR